MKLLNPGASGNQKSRTPKLAPFSGYVKCFNRMLNEKKYIEWELYLILPKTRNFYFPYSVSYQRLCSK